MKIHFNPKSIIKRSIFALPFACTVLYSCHSPTQTNQGSSINRTDPPLESPRRNIPTEFEMPLNEFLQDPRFTQTIGNEKRFATQFRLVCVRERETKEEREKYAPDMRNKIFVTTSGPRVTIIPKDNKSQPDLTIIGALVDANGNVKSTAPDGIIEVYPGVKQATLEEMLLEYNWTSACQEVGKPTVFDKSFLRPNEIKTPSFPPVQALFHQRSLTIAKLS